MHLLEECTQLKVFLNILSEFDARIVLVLAENVELLSVPIMEKLEKLDVLGEYILKIGRVKAFNNIRCCKTVRDNPDTIYKSQIMLFQIRY